MPASPFTLLLPGTACDHRLLSPQLPLFPSPHLVPPWLPPILHESIPAYAQRLAHHLGPLPQPLTLLGISLGSFIAQELIPLLQPHRVILIATARSRSELRPAIRLPLALASRLPPTLLRSCFPLAAFQFFAGLENLPSPQAHLLHDMFCAQHPLHLPWALRAIATWTPPDLSPFPAHHLLRIHGSQDSLIHPPPLPPTPHSRIPNTHLIPNAGHLVSLSHPTETNQAIATFLHSTPP